MEQVKRDMRLPNIITWSQLQQKAAIEEQHFFKERIFLPDAAEFLQVDLIEDEENICLFYKLSDANPENIRVLMSEKTVHIIKDEPSDENGAITKFPYTIGSQGRNERKILLPAIVDVDSVDCIFDNGILNIKVKKAALSKPVEVNIQFK